MSNLQTVQDIYAAFGRGDVPAILARLSDDVDWEYGATPCEVPWLKTRKGRGGAGEFFATLAGMQIEHFTPTVFLDHGDLVVVLVNVRFTVKVTGRQVVEEDEVHIWRFDAQGRVCRFRHRVDTLAQQRAVQA